MFDFKEIEAFVWIVRLGSFRLAAQHLHLTQPSISDRIARLEGFVGGPLLDRAQRPIQPTPKGRQFYHHAQHMLETRQEAMTMLEANNPFQGVLRLGVVETIAHSWLPAFIAELANRFPDMTLQLEVDGTPGLANRLLNRQIDMAFTLGPVDAQDILSRPLCHYATGLIATPQLGFSAQTFTLEALARTGTPLITFASDSRPYRELQSLLHQQRLERIKLHCSGSVWTIVRLALDGIGVGAIPPRIVKQEIARGELITLPCDLPRLDFAASWPQHIDKALADGVIDLAIELGQRDQREHA